MKMHRNIRRYTIRNLVEEVKKDEYRTGI